MRDALDDLGAVDGDVHRLAHALVGHHRPVGLEAVIHQLEVGLGLLHVQHRRGLDLLQELQRDLVGDVELAGHHGGEPARILRHDLDRELLELHRALVLVQRGAPPVGVVALQHDLGARLPRFEAPRAGAVDRLGAVVLAQRLDALLVVDRRGEHGEVEQQVGERLVQLVLDRVGIGGADVLEVAGAPGERRLELGAGQPLEGVDHVVGGELLAAAEAHVVAQLEGVELAVGADGPRLGEIGDGGLAVPVHRHQRVLEHVDDVGGRRPGRALAVVMRRIERLHHAQGLRLGQRSDTDDAKQRSQTRQRLRIVVSSLSVILGAATQGRVRGTSCNGREVAPLRSCARLRSR